MTPAEIRAFNAGVLAVLKVAHDTAEALLRTTRRPVHEGFAIAALAELVEAGKGLFLPLPPADAPGQALPPDRPRSPAPVEMLSSAIADQDRS